MSLRTLKEKRASINKTRKVTRAMEMVSAVKMRKSQERALGGRAYARGALRILREISGATDTREHFMMRERASGAHGLIIITSDKGLAGSLNSAVLKRADECLARARAGDDADVVCVCIGKRGHDFARARNLTVLHFEENRRDDVSPEDMARIVSHAFDAHRAERTRAWDVVYTNFKSTFEQEAVARRVLPLSRDALADVIDGIVPEKGAYAESDARASDDESRVASFTIEPSAESVLDAVVPQLANIIVYHALLESKASEHSARMVAMKNATDKAGELSHDLKLRFNKARQAAITREVSEITSGIEAMKT